jgi:multiple sugar transport system substrate-binding protein
MTRRDVLRLGAGLASAAAVGPFVLRIAGAGESFNWQRFRGSKIYVLFTKHPWNDTVQRMLPEFEKLTGIKVDFTDLPEIQARQKATVEFTAGSGGVDAWYTSLLIEKRRFWKSGWYLDLSKYLKDPTMTAPDYDWDDMAAGARESVVQSDGTISGLPAFVDPWIFFYRKDLFAQQGLRPPRTLAEMEEFAQKFHNEIGRASCRERV